ncbi:hypothetical protein Glove_54g35 [Diversispora epigaea]|uniref:Alkyl transferase n=1 Tax=Diversispora epigaea TaxID=1348612 RepID=A0A397JG38_9GLOM|nr:hypothetical protein Glove_54g35 [Diversispora epigaea]
MNDSRNNNNNNNNMINDNKILDHDNNENEPEISVNVAANFFTSTYNFFSQHFNTLFIKILRQGPIPKHIGFIMDGNRRYAKKNNKKIIEGHQMGFDTLHSMLEVCKLLGINTVTVYAFSIENFKRPPDEVNKLMGLAKEKLIELCEKSKIIKKHKIRIRILGNMKYLDSDLLEVINKAVETTKYNTGSTLNVCFAYTSRDEMTISVKSIVKMVESEQLQIKDVNENLLEQNLFTCGNPPLEILIRTSGEIRLSDFLLWQCNQNCYIKFVNCYWPEFSISHILPIILEYQVNYKSFKEKRIKSDQTMQN